MDFFPDKSVTIISLKTSRNRGILRIKGFQEMQKRLHLHSFSEGVLPDGVMATQQILILLF